VQVPGCRQWGLQGQPLWGSHSSTAGHGWAPQPRQRRLGESVCKKGWNAAQQRGEKCEKQPCEPQGKRRICSPVAPGETTLKQVSPCSSWRDHNGADIHTAAHGGPQARTGLSWRTSLWRCCGLAWLNARCPQKPCYHSPSSTGHRRKKYDERLVSQDKDRKRSLTNYCHGQNRLNLWKKKFNFSPIKSE